MESDDTESDASLPLCVYHLPDKLDSSEDELLPIFKAANERSILQGDTFFFNSNIQRAYPTRIQLIRTKIFL